MEKVITMNKKMKMSQALMLLLLAALIFITPLLSTSLRHTYLYFITNLLIIALGAEAGLLNHPQDHKITKTSNVTPNLEGHDHKTMSTTISYGGDHENKSKANIKVVEIKSKMESFMMIKKCPSMPSIFFIGGGDGDQDDHDEEDDDDRVVVEEEEEDIISGQELFTKAETFIGNFYKQLKMQREDSWKRIHGFYQKAF